MKKLSALCLVLSAAAFGPMMARAQVSQFINYQGRLLSGTNLVNGNVGLSLRLFNVPSGGSSLYEDSNSVAVVDGLYSTFIGDNPTNIFSMANVLTNRDLYVEVAVNGVTLTPREKVGSTAFSMATRGITVNAFGDVGIGTDTPDYKLDVQHDGNSGMRIGAPTNGGYSVLDIDSGNGESAIRFQKDGVSKWNMRNSQFGGFDLLLNNILPPIFNVSTNGHFGFGDFASSDVFADFRSGRLRLRQDPDGSTAGLWLYQNDPVLHDRAFIGMNNDGYVGFYGNAGAGWDFNMNVTNGYVGFGTTPNGTNRITVAGGAFCSGNGTTWVNASDKNLKSGFESVDPQAVLEKVAALPLTTWHYKDENASSRHLGPMAQDFSAAFGLGYDDKSISTVDASGVALAAIQALATDGRAQKEKIGKLEDENAALKKQLDEVLARLRALETK